MLTVCVAAVLLTTGLIAGAGCGKSSGSTETTAGVESGTSQTTSTDVASSGTAGSGKVLTRDALVAEANAICKRIAAQGIASHRPKSQQDLNRRVVRLTVYDQGQLTALSRLRPPGSMESEWKPVAELARSFAAGMTKFGNALRENRDKFAYGQVFPTVTAIEQKLIAAALRVGLKDCRAI
jgi:hypothetical protein